MCRLSGSPMVCANFWQPCKWRTGSRPLLLPKPLTINLTVLTAENLKNVFSEKKIEHLHTPYVLHTGDIKEEDSIIYLPLYMTPLL